MGHERASAQGAGPGLVTSKTTPNEQQNQRSRRAGEHLDLTFSKEETARKRIARMKKGVWFSGQLHESMCHRKGHRPDVAWFVTLTYIGVNDWSPEHLTRATDAYRRFCRRLGVPARYLWVSELQRRGAVHYHLVAWLPRGVRMPKWDVVTVSPSGRCISPIWPHGMANRQKVRERRSSIGYLMKYLSKTTPFHVFPDGLRLFGVGGLDAQSRAVRTWSNLPEWAKREYGVGELVRSGSSLVLVDTGEIVPPMWSRQLMPCGLRLLLLRDYPQRFHDGAYSSIFKT